VSRLIDRSQEWGSPEWWNATNSDKHAECEADRFQPPLLLPHNPVFEAYFSAVTNRRRDRGAANEGKLSEESRLRLTKEFFRQ